MGAQNHSVVGDFRATFLRLSLDHDPDRDVESQSPGHP
jgi:hypothetical protein